MSNLITLSMFWLHFDRSCHFPDRSKGFITPGVEPQLPAWGLVRSYIEMRGVLICLIARYLL